MQAKFAHAVETGRRAARALPDYAWSNAWPLVAEAWVLDETDPLYEALPAIRKGWWDERCALAHRRALVLLDANRMR